VSRPNDTVVFGPFIGEFGWELMHWSMWVENVSKSEFRDFKKIVVSRQGHNFLYPSANEFIAIPDQIVRLIRSPRNYICDGLFSGYPGNTTDWKFRLRDAVKDTLEFRFPHKYSVDDPGIDSGLLQKLLTFRDEIGSNQKSAGELRYYSPFELNHFNNMTFGFNSQGDLRNMAQPSRILPIPVKNQFFENLIDPAAKLSNAFEFSSMSDGIETVCVFPRRRLDRREDKNLSEGEYLSIITDLQSKYRVAILGTPSGSYFSNGVPSGCIDFVNLPQDIRLQEQIRILSKSKFAVGGTSGALLLSLRVGIPVKMIGPKSELKRLRSYDALGAGVSEFKNENI
jgi:hypothetical protein